MSRTWTLCLVGLAAMAIAGGCHSNEKTAEKPGPAERTEPLTIIKQVSANDEGFQLAQGTAILTRAELEGAKSTELTKLDIDFNKQSLVIVALGEEPSGGYWVQITGVQRRGTQLYVQGIANRPGKETAGPAGKTYPVAAVVVPRLDTVTAVNEEIDSVEGQAVPAAVPTAADVPAASAPAATESK